MIRTLQLRLGSFAAAKERGEVTQPRSLVRNIGWTLIGNLGYALCQWGILIALAKLSNPETVGRYALALSISAPIMLLANLNLRAVQATDVKQDFVFADYFALRAMTTVAALIVVGAILLATRYDRSTSLVVVFIALAKAAESGSDTFYGMMQQHERMDVIARSMLIRGGVSLAVMVAVIGATGNIVAGAASLFAVWATVLIAYDGRLGRSFLKTLNLPVFRRPLNWTALTSLAVLALPLGMVQLLISLNTNVPRYFVEHNLGTHDLGIFAAIAYLVSGASTGVIAVCNAASPRLARWFQSDDIDAFVRLITKLVLLFAVACVVAVIGAKFVGAFVLTHIYTAEYADASDVLVLLSIGFGLAAIVSVLGYGLTAARSFKPQVPAVGAAILTTLLGCAVLIPRYGLEGAAAASVTADVVWVMVSAYALVRIVRGARARLAAE